MERADTVYWILAAIMVLITLAVPRLRPVGIVGIVVLAAMLSWAMVQRLSNREATAPQPGQRGTPTSPVPMNTALPLASVSTDDLLLAGSGAPFELSGRVTNGAPDAALKSITLRITRRDCYEGAIDPSGCMVIWQDQHWIDVAVPPRQSRRFAVSIWAHSAVPRARGTIKDEFVLLAATGEPVAPH